MWWLCILPVTTEKPVQACLYQVKKSEKGDTFKKKATWPLRQLKIFDAKYANKVTTEIQIHLLSIFFKL